MPPITEISLAGSPIVTDEWIEALATNHAHSLRRLDLSGCHSITSSSRPLRALQRLLVLEHLRLPAEKWDEHELAACLTSLPNLRTLDEDTYSDLRQERDALRAQCDILCNTFSACMTQTRGETR